MSGGEIRNPGKEKNDLASITKSEVGKPRKLPTADVGNEVSFSNCTVLRLSSNAREIPMICCHSANISNRHLTGFAIKVYNAWKSKAGV
mmetsp:Transcript_11720/g.23862  ORF Transcript_11720/g.23862 Transcript_11720/m.23862 type:complete len:89 (-) Transcript_11720:750-1016(-)